MANLLWDPWKTLVGSVWFLLCLPSGNFFNGQKPRVCNSITFLFQRIQKKNQIVTKPSSEISRCSIRWIFFSQLNLLWHWIRYYWLLHYYLKLRNRIIWAVACKSCRALLSSLLMGTAMEIWQGRSLPSISTLSYQLSTIILSRSSKKLLEGFHKENRHVLYKDR